MSRQLFKSLDDGASAFTLMNAPPLLFKGTVACLQWNERRTTKQNTTLLSKVSTVLVFSSHTELKVAIFI